MKSDWQMVTEKRQMQQSAVEALTTFLPLLAAGLTAPPPPPSAWSCLRAAVLARG
jgi:hypothetical protein